MQAGIVVRNQMAMNLCMIDHVSIINSLVLTSISNAFLYLNDGLRAEYGVSEDQDTVVTMADTKW